MTDPIRPFVSIIESIARAGQITQTGESSTLASADKQQSRKSGEPSALSLAERLSARLAVIDRNDRSRRRQAFVELALLSEFGDQLALDHALGDLVEKVSTIIAADPQTATDLDAMIDQLST